MLLAAGRAMVASADEQAMNAQWPPAHYRLEDARIVIDTLPAHGMPRQTLTLAGDRPASFANGSTVLHYPMASSEWLAVINAFYQIRFFDLPARVLPPRSVYLRDDGLVGTQARRLHDTPASKVCFSLPQFEKCVAFDADSASALDQLAGRLLATARQRTGSGQK